MERQELFERYGIQAGGILMLISFFLPCYKISLFASWAVEISGYNIIRIFNRLDFLSPTDLEFEILAYVIAPILFGVSGVLALFKNQILAGWSWMYALFIFGYSWYLADWNSLFEFASWGFYLGLAGATLVIMGERVEIPAEAEE